jgi:hypothetical protein
VLRVEVENPRADWNRLSGRPIHARERRCHAEGGDYQAGRHLPITDSGLHMILATRS